MVVELLLHFVVSSLFPRELVRNVWAADHPLTSSQRDIVPQCTSDLSLSPLGKNRGMSCGKTCREDRDDEWMGVSLARQPKADGRVLVRPPGGAWGRGGTQNE